jgi:co-chaperonin GroES (HSP10)
MITPLNDRILVERVEEEGVLTVISDKYAIVKVIAIGPISDSVTLKPYIKMGGEFLVEKIEEYSVKDKSVFFVPLENIVATL